VLQKEFDKTLGCDGDTESSIDSKPKLSNHSQLSLPENAA